MPGSNPRSWANGGEQPAAFAHDAYLGGIAESEGVAAFNALRPQWAAQLSRNGHDGWS
jgi:hypothetical protein